jgi:hypothetical protein
LATTKPIDQNLGPEGAVEEVRLQENYGEFLALNDHGEGQIPHRPNEPADS